MNTSLLKNLDVNQREAVCHTNGPLLVLAGAGSGKTRVLSHRIARLVGDKHCKPENILAVTFTNKAAAQMQERIAKLTSEKTAKLMSVSTFHSFGARILRNHGSAIGITKNFSIISENDRASTLKSIIRNAGKGREKEDLFVLGMQISLAKNSFSNGVPSDDSVSDDRRFLRIYKEYSAALHQRHCVDFDDLLLLPLQLFREHPKVLQGYRDLYHYISIDEFQDTNAVQMQLCRFLAEPRNNIMVVGDDDQSIYSWRGAQIDNILKFSAIFKKCKTVILDTNYRSTSEIVEAAAGVIANNQIRKQKNVNSALGHGNSISTFCAEDEEEEIQWIISQIQENQKAGKYLYKDHALLFRTNAMMARFEEQFRLERIPYKVQGAMSFFDRKEVKDVFAYLRFFANSHDEISLMRFLKVPNKGITPTTIQKLEDLAGLRRTSLWEAFVHYNDAHDLEESQKEKCCYVVDFYKRYTAEFTTSSLSETVRKLLQESRYLELLQSAYKNDKTLQMRLDNVNEIVHTLELFEKRNKAQKPTLARYIQDCSLVVNDDPEEDKHQKGVILMTLHKAKGLEFPVVILPVLDDAVFPSQQSCLEGKIEEERRLFYVGMTRAQKKLILTSPASKLFRSKNIKVKPCRFIFEIPEQYLDGKFGEKEQEELQQSNLDFFADLKKKFAKN